MMKKLWILFGTMLVLIGCSNAGNNQEAIPNNNKEIELAPSITGDKTEGFKLVHEQAHKTVVYEDEAIKMTLTQSIHGRSNVRDLIELKFSIENKTDNVYHLNYDQFMFDDQQVEGSKISMFGTTVNEDSTTVLDAMVSNENELQFKESIYGEFRLKTEDGGEETLEFHEAIEYD